MNITIKVIPDSEHRYPFTGADWFWNKDGSLEVRVSKMSDWRREFLLSLHEMVEAVLCKHNGVSQESVDEFDTEFDKTHLSDINAGDDPSAPYEHEHCVATAVERVVAAEMRVQWNRYDAELSAFPSRQEKRIVREHVHQPGYGTGESDKAE